MQITGVNVILTCPGRNYVFVKILTDEPGSLPLKFTSAPVS